MSEEKEPSFVAVTMLRELLASQEKSFQSAMRLVTDDIRVN